MDLHRLIASGKTKEAVNALLEAFKGVDDDLYNEAVMLSARLEKYLKNKRLGLIDSDVELRNIEYSLLQLSHHAGIRTGRKTRKRLQGLIWLSALLLLSTAVYLFFENRSPAPLQAAEKQAISGDTLAQAPGIASGSERSEQIKLPPHSRDPQREQPVSPAVEKSSPVSVKTQPAAPVTDSVIQTDRRTESPPEKIEYITFKLVLNALSHDYTIWVDGKPAEIVDDSSPIIKTIRLKKSDQAHHIEIRQGNTVKCQKEGLIIANNQKINLPSCNF